MVKTDLVLPEIYNKNLQRRQREESGFALKILGKRRHEMPRESRTGTHLVLASFSSVRSLHVHDHDIHFFASTHPYSCVDCQDSAYTLSIKLTFSSLLPSCFVHDIECRAEEPVKQSTWTIMLGAGIGKGTEYLISSLFPVDCEPNTATILYPKPASRRPHRPICALRSGLRT